jgi:glycosyltransferase involved in cell wall biosynthesis
MKIDIVILAYNEERIIAYAIRHYQTFARRIRVYDGRSTDRTREIARAMGAEVVDWDTGDRLNDQMALELKNSCWKGSDADWVGMLDADELLYFPAGVEATIAAYEAQGLAMVRPYGWNMLSETFPTGPGQIYDEIRHGARYDSLWGYGKPVFFRPSLVRETGFNVGAHDSKTVLVDGTRLPSIVERPFSNPTAYLLHFKWIGPTGAIVEQLRVQRSRLSADNIAKHWGDYQEAAAFEHQARADIRERLELVIKPAARLRVAVAVSGQIRSFAKNAAGLDAMFKAAAGPGAQVDWFGALWREDVAWAEMWPWTSVAILHPQRNPEIKGLPIFYPGNRAESEQMIWQQWQGYLVVGSLVRLAEEAQGNLCYDWVIRCRPDLQVVRPMEALSTLTPDGIYAPSHDNWNGINDRFAFGPSLLMEQYFKLGTTVYQYFAQPKPLTRPDSRNPEGILRRHLERLGIPRRFTRAVFNTLRVNGELIAPTWRGDREDYLPMRIDAAPQLRLMNPRVAAFKGLVTPVTHFKVTREGFPEAVTAP